MSKAANRVLFEITEKIDRVLLGRFCQALFSSRSALSTSSAVIRRILR